MSLCLGKSKPFLLINAQGLAAEIRKCPVNPCKSVTMDRPLIEIENELDELEKAAQLSIKAITALRMMAQARRLELAMCRDNSQIAEELSSMAKTE